jgi:hypothetical protein
MDLEDDLYFFLRSCDKRSFQLFFFDLHVPPLVPIIFFCFSSGTFYLRRNQKFLSPFWENNMVLFPFPSHIFMSLANLWLIRLQGQFVILRIISFHDLYPLIRLHRRTLGKGRILIPGFVLFPPE